VDSEVDECGIRTESFYCSVLYGVAYLAVPEH
jgi:hypothetical protein